MIEALVEGARAVAAAQARQLVNVATYVCDETRADRLEGEESGKAGRGACTEAALALRVSRGTVERQHARRSSTAPRSSTRHNVERSTPT